MLNGEGQRREMPEEVRKLKRANDPDPD